MALAQRTKAGWELVRTSTVVAPDGGKISRAAALRAIAAGDTEFMARFGLADIGKAEVPEGKRAVGEVRIEEVDGTPVMVRDLEDAPAPDPAATDTDRLMSVTGMSIAQIKNALGILAR